MKIEKIYIPCSIFFVFLTYSNNFFDVLKIQSKSIFDTELSKARNSENKELIDQIEQAIKKVEEAKKEKFFIILIASYNNADYYKKNIDSVLQQKYSSYLAVYMDDMSTDKTYDLVKDHLAEYDVDKHFLLIKNQKKKYCLKNYIDAIHSFCPDNTVLVTLDGDDWFAHEKVLSFLNNVYQNQNIWLAHGNPVILSSGKLYSKHFSLEIFEKPIPSDILEYGIRKAHYWSVFHPRSFYTKLFRQIKINDLKDKKRIFFKHTEDMAFMIPMIEMATGNHIMHLNEPLYIYNNKNILSTGLVWDNDKLNKTINEILFKIPYSPIKDLWSI